MHQDDQIIHLEGSSDDSGDYVEQNDHGKLTRRKVPTISVEGPTSSPSYQSGQFPLMQSGYLSGQHPMMRSGRLLLSGEFIPDPTPMKSQLFGTKYWSMHAMDNQKKKKIEDEETIFGKPGHYSFSPGNILWGVLFGWWIGLIFLLVSFLLQITVVASTYSGLCYQLARYVAWPFGKFIVHSKAREEDQATLPLNERSSLVNSWKPLQTITGDYIVWMIFYSVFIAPGFGRRIAAKILVMAIVGVICWLFVVMVPMAKINFTLLRLLYSQPMLLTITTDYSAASSHPVLLCTYRAFSKRYLSYTLFGVNIFFMNAVPIVVARALLLLIQMGTGEHLLSPMSAFFFDLFCAIPITFFIGLSISCITIQTNYMVGALLNASFGSLTELILFTLAIRKGALNDLILYSLTGGLLNDMLLIPGLSMIAGGIKYKEQRFNPIATGVGSLLFFVAIIGAFTPSIFYKAFGGYTQRCTGCVETIVNGTLTTECFQCHYYQVEMDKDPLFTGGVAYLIYVVTALLPIAYIIEEDGEAEEAPEWSIALSSLIMVISVLIFGLIAEDIVEIVEHVLVDLGVEQSFLGVTLIALTPAATEIANAVRFALVNQVSLSVQIGAQSAVQVALVQMPCLTLIALIFSDPDNAFHLIFPNLSIFAVTLAVFAFNYISVDGSTNYFVGCVLVIMYILLISAFYFVPGNLE